MAFIDGDNGDNFLTVMPYLYTPRTIENDGKEMAREEEIKQAAFMAYPENIGYSTIGDAMYDYNSEPRRIWLAGAMWTDQHPVNYDNKTALYFNNIVYENGYKEAVDKACEWLYDNLYTRRDKQSPANHFVCSKQEMLTQTEFVEQFRKAMEGE